MGKGGATNANVAVTAAGAVQFTEWRADPPSDHAANPYCASPTDRTPVASISRVDPDAHHTVWGVGTVAPWTDTSRPAGDVATVIRNSVR